MSITVGAVPGDKPVAGQVLRWIARAILICIAAFWIWFGVMDGLGDSQTLGVMGFVMMLPAALIVLGVLYVAWRWELAGAILLLVITAGGLFAFSQNLRGMGGHGAGAQLWPALGLLSVFVLPFLVPALLLLAKCVLERKNRPAASDQAA